MYRMYNPGRLLLVLFEFVFFLKFDTIGKKQPLASLKYRLCNK